MKSYFRIPLFFLNICAAFAILTQVSSGQSSEIKPKRFALVNVDLIVDPADGIKEFSRLEKYVAEKLLANEKTDLPVYDDGQTQSLRHETVTQFLRTVEREQHVLFFDFIRLSRTGSLLAANPEFDLTYQIVEFFNSANGVPRSTFKNLPPDGKIALIDTSRLWDSKTGHQHLVPFIRKYGNLADVCRNTNVCFQLGRAFTDFAKKKGYGLLFDRSGVLPPAIRPFELTDRTNEFMAEFKLKDKKGKPEGNGIGFPR